MHYDSKVGAFGSRMSVLPPPTHQNPLVSEGGMAILLHLCRCGYLTNIKTQAVLALIVHHAHKAMSPAKFRLNIVATSIKMNHIIKKWFKGECHEINNHT